MWRFIKKNLVVWKKLKENCLIISKKEKEIEIVYWLGVNF